MSIKVMASVWEHSKQEGTALLMLLAIADTANEFGEAWPGVDSLAEKCRMKRRNAQLLLKRLEESGELVIARQEGQQTAHGKTNMFTVVTPGALVRHGVQSSTPHAKDYTPRGAILYTPAPQGVQDNTPQGVQSSTPKPSVNTLNVDGVAARLKALGLMPGQIETARTARPELSLDELTICEAWVDSHRARFDKPEVVLYSQYLKRGEIPPTERVNGSPDQIPRDEHGNVHPSYFRGR